MIGIADTRGLVGWEGVEIWKSHLGGFVFPRMLDFCAVTGTGLFNLCMIYLRCMYMRDDFGDVGHLRGFVKVFCSVLFSSLGGFLGAGTGPWR